jgi:hypothetical protein
MYTAGAGSGQAGQTRFESARHISCFHSHLAGKHAADTGAVRSHLVSVSFGDWAWQVTREASQA